MSDAPEDTLKPLDVDGVTAIGTGTAAFTVGLVLTLVFRSTLADHGAGWWIWVCAAGSILGVMGLSYVVKRRTVYRAAKQGSEPTPPTNEG